MRQIFSVAVIVCAVLLGACGGGDDSNEPSVPRGSGPLSASEIEAGPQFTYDEYMVTYESIVAAKPQLLDDQVAFTREMFESLKAIRRERPLADYVGAAEQLNKEERRVVWSQIPMIDVYRNFRTKAPAETAAATSFRTCDPTTALADTKEDAIRHSYWNALMAKRTSISSAKKLADAHEFEPPDPRASAMDLHNNEVGRRIAGLYPAATESETLDILLRLKTIYVAPGIAIPDDFDALVYLKDQAPYDGTFTGTLSNPDAGQGTVWQATLSFNQCGATLRGQLVEVLGSNKQLRRFTGQIDVTGSIILSIADPYSFENFSKLNYCTGMTTQLSGTLAALSGSWTSTNCKRGGVISISK